MKRKVVVSGGFDDLGPHQLRFLEEASKLGNLTVVLWPDKALRDANGAPPKFPLTERKYMVGAVRYINRLLAPANLEDPNSLPELQQSGFTLWVDEEHPANARRAGFCERHGLEYRILPASQVQGFPPPPPFPKAESRKKVVVTGCFDWLHSGHVRFFEEVSGYGDLYVIIGHDANIRLLKGPGHPLLPEAQRRYAVGSIKFVKEALVSSGDGWLDADPEIRRLRPDIYAVNEDGDRGGKREYCQQLGVEYLVLKRTPAPGLAARTSTELRGF